MSVQKEQKEQSKSKMSSNGRGTSHNMRGKQGKKDSRARRVNFDNERESKFDDMKVTGKCNDVSWYAKSPELLRSAASLPFSTTTGEATGFTDGEAVPGVMSIYWNPALGGIGNYAVNAAANSNYSFTVHANSRNTKYTATDQMILVLAGAQVFSFLANGIRAYGVMKRYDQRNRYLPEALVNAMGFDFDDLQNQLSNMWFTLNELIVQVSQIWIPNDMPFVERWFWMNSNVYMDAGSVKAQYYVFTPKQVLKYDEVGSETGGQLIPVSTWNGETKNTWSTYLTAIRSMIAALLNSEDRGIIFGDILKAYTAEKIYTVNEIPSDYTVIPVYDQEVLTQIENSTAFPVNYSSITQSNGSIITNWPSTAAAANAATIVPAVQVLNFHTDGIPTPEMNMVATRLKIAGMYGKEASGTYTITQPWAMGTEYVYEYAIWLTTSSGVIGAMPFSNVVNTTNPAYTVIFRRWSAFDWAPWLYECPTAPTLQTGSTYVPKSALGDYDQYTTVNMTELLKMHNTAVYSEFGVPTSLN